MKNPCPSKKRGNRHRWDPHASSLEHRTCRYCGALGKVDKQGVVQFVAGIQVTSITVAIKRYA